MGMISPVSLACTSRMAPLRVVLSHQTLHLPSFDIRPNGLSDSVTQRLCFVFSGAASAESATMNSTLDAISAPRAVSRTGQRPDIVGDATGEQQRREDAEGVGRVDQRQGQGREVPEDAVGAIERRGRHRGEEAEADHQRRDGVADPRRQRPARAREPRHQVQARRIRANSVVRRSVHSSANREEAPHASCGMSEHGAEGGVFAGLLEGDDEARGVAWLDQRRLLAVDLEVVGHVTDVLESERDGAWPRDRPGRELEEELAASTCTTVVFADADPDGAIARIAIATASVVSSFIALSPTRASRRRVRSAGACRTRARRRRRAACRRRRRGRS
jgi:hypothetical protein